MERNQPYEPRTGAWRHLYASIAWDEAPLRSLRRGRGHAGRRGRAAFCRLARLSAVHENTEGGVARLLPGALPGEEQVVKDWLAEGGRGDLVGRPERLSLSQRRQAADTGMPCHLPRCLLTPAAGFSTASRRCRLTRASIGECGMW